MSQYPSPYQPPPPPGHPYAPMGYPPPPDLLGPARNGGLMMMIMGTLMALCAGCFVAGGFALESNPQMPPEQQEVFQQIEADVQKTVGMTLPLLFKVAGGIIAVPALMMVLLGLFVRRGQMVAIVLGILVTGLCVFMLLLSMVGNLAAAARGDVSGLCVAIVPLALFGLQLYWLSKAVMNAGPLKVFNAQQQAYQWQMSQQSAQQQQYFQQMYQQQGYNYPPAAPPPPPPPAAPGGGPGQPPPPLP